MPLDYGKAAGYGGEKEIIRHGNNVPESHRSMLSV